MADASAQTPRHRWRVALSMLALALALLWPAIVQQRPSYFFDSAGYLSTGTKSLVLARDRLEAKVAKLTGAAPAATAKAAAPVRAPDSVVSIRAIAYSIFAALTAAPDGKLYVLIAVNALIITLLVWEFWRVRAPNALPRDIAIAAFFVASATSAPWFVTYAMPDVLAGAAIIAMLILTFAPLHQHRLARLAVAGVVAFAVAAHASHVPIVGLMVAASVAELAWEAWRGAGWSWRRLAWVTMPFAAGMAVIVALSLAGFGSVSVAPKRLPFALARSIGDGPGKWYLEATCAEKKWAVCPFFYATGMRGQPLLFHPGGLIASATPAQMEAVRNQEMIIVRAATAAYPMVQVRAVLRNSWRQFFRFGLADNSFDFVIDKTGVNEWHVRRTTELHDLRSFAQPMIYGGVVLATLYLLTLLRSLRPGEAGTLRLMLAGLIVNASVTGALSTLTSRYQSRVIWVVPVVALAFWLARHQVRAPSRQSSP